MFLLFNPLNAELNPICHLLALIGAHHILHISRIRVNTKTDGIFNFSCCQGVSCGNYLRLSKVYYLYPLLLNNELTVAIEPETNELRSFLVEE